MQINQPSLLLPEEFTVYLARHATPDHSRRDIPYAIPPGPELTEQGRQEAAQLGAFLRSLEAARVFASPLERALRTAAIAGTLAGLPVEVNDDLAEWRSEELEREVQTRMERIFSAAAQLSCAQSAPVVLVSHGGPVMAMLKLLGMPSPVADRCRIYDGRNLIPPAGAWRVEKLDGELRIDLVFVPKGVRTLENII
jgi:broad specificity phosphatase PhoE